MHLRHGAPADDRDRRSQARGAAARTTAAARTAGSFRGEYAASPHAFLPAWLCGWSSAETIALLHGFVLLSEHLLERRSCFVGSAGEHHPAGLLGGSCLGGGDRVAAVVAADCSEKQIDHQRDPVDHQVAPGQQLPGLGGLSEGPESEPAGRLRDLHSLPAAARSAPDGIVSLLRRLDSRRAELGDRPEQDRLTARFQHDLPAVLDVLHGGQQQQRQCHPPPTESLRECLVDPPHRDDYGRAQRILRPEQPRLRGQVLGWWRRLEQSNRGLWSAAPHRREGAADLFHVRPLPAHRGQQRRHSQQQ